MQYFIDFATIANIALLVSIILNFYILYRQNKSLALMDDYIEGLGSRINALIHWRSRMDIERLKGKIDMTEQERKDLNIAERNIAEYEKMVEERRKKTPQN